MELTQFTWTLLLMLSVDGSAGERCPASTGTSFNLSVASRRNVTGHWILSVDGVREDTRQPSSTNSPVEVVIDVGHRTASCEDKETVQLTATGAVNAVSAVRKSTEIPPVTHSGDSETTATSDAPPSVTVTSSQVPPAGYEVVNGLGYYKMHTDALTWEQARDTCIQEGAHLIIINSDPEAEVATTLLTRDKSKIQGTSTTNLAYVGFSDIATEGKYTTVLGEPLSSSGYTRWTTNAWHNDTEYNCGIVYIDGMLNVHPSRYKYAFICEITVQ